MASIEPGVLPSMALAALPTAMPSSRTSFVPFLTATTLGSFRMIPRPRTHTSVLAVPRSIPMSTEKLPRTHSRGFRNEAMESAEMGRRRGTRGAARAGEARRASDGGRSAVGSQCTYARSPFKRTRARTGSRIGRLCAALGVPPLEEAVEVQRLHLVHQQDRRDEQRAGEDREAGVDAETAGGRLAAALDLGAGDLLRLGGRARGGPGAGAGSALGHGSGTSLSGERGGLEFGGGLVAGRDGGLLVHDQPGAHAFLDVRDAHLALELRAAVDAEGVALL